MADILLNSWFLWVPVGLFWIFWQAWTGYVRAHFMVNHPPILLEIKVPRDIAKSPKAMESILAGIHGTRRLGNFVERYWDGWITGWFSLEIVGDETGVHFYIWGQKFFKRMLEAQIYAQYPSAEIKEVEDYTKQLPDTFPEDEWKAWGSEFLLTKPDAYPIRTYEDFTLEDLSSKEEERKVDPLSSLVEFFGALGEGEKFWLQILVEPAGDDWKKEGEKLAAKLAGRPAASKTSVFGYLVDSVNETLALVFGLPSPAAPQKKEEQFLMFRLSPGETDVLKAVEKNIAKLGFNIGMRWLYLARHDKFNYVAVPGIMGIFKQFASPALNGFKLNSNVTTSVDYWFEKTRVRLRAIRLYNAYRLRSCFHPPYKGRSKTFVLNTTELATIYHFPGLVVGAPSFERIEAKRGAPPANLPV